MTIVGILHPGSMGAALAAELTGSGHRVLWAGAGRSPATQARAEAAGLVDVGDVGALAAEAQVILSVCPPDAAEEVAVSVAGAGYTGRFADLNAISPDRAVAIARSVGVAGGRAVDGSIVAAPPGGQLPTTVYLSGPDADVVAELFAGTSVATRIVGAEPGAASALKLAFSVVTKGVQAVFATGAAMAEGWGLGDAYADLLASENNSAPSQVTARMPQVAARAWRFADEMDETAAACRQLGLHDGVATAAADVYERWAHHRDDDSTPLGPLLDELLERRPGTPTAG